MKLPTGGLSFICQGISRIKINSYVQKEPYFVADVERLLAVKRRPKDSKNCVPLI
jgi:hypothetical protein